MKPPRDIVRFLKGAPVETKSPADVRILGRMRAAYADSAGVSVRRPVPSRIARLAVAAAILIAAGALVGHLLPFAGGSVAWADVSRQFKAVPFFSVAIYMKENATAEPNQMELWMSHEGRIRLRKGTQVVFAHGGWRQAYDIESRRVVELDEMARVFIEKIGQAQEFSLEAIIEVMFGGEATEVTPLINPDAVISQDVVVFDVTLPHTPEWVRIWALRESRLPMRITIWDPRDGASTDAVFTYSREPPAEFFDPNAFESVLRTRSGAGRANVVYAFLKDAGGRDITPEDMFAASGYHVPVIEQIGITADGAVWVIAAQGRNQMPNGYSFFGFGTLDDDLGRPYRLVHSSHRTATDQSMEVYVPDGYPFDSRTPARLILTCREEHGPQGKPVTVGTCELTQWQQRRPWPEGTIDRGEPEILLQAAFRYCENEEFDLCRRIVDKVLAGAERPQLEHTVNRLRLRMLLRQRSYDEAAALALELGPTQMQRYLHDAQWPDPYQFVDIVVAAAAAGRIEEAHDLWQQVKAAEPDLPGWQKRHADRFHEEFPEAIRRAESEIVRALARIELPEDAIGNVIGCDVAADEQYRGLIASEKSRGSSAATRRDAEQRLKELAAYYESHPLPERAELLERPDERNIYLVGVGNELPGHAGYRILPINTSISGLVSTLKLVGGDDSEAARVHPYKAAVRFAEGLEDRELRADLVYREEMEFPERVHNVLASLGMAVTLETRPAQTVLVAQYDGRKLRNHAEVYAPWHRNNGGSGVRVWRVADLLEQLALQAPGGAFLLDQTGIAEPVCVGIGEPHWQGAEGAEQARQWLREQFGITIAAETRPLTTYLVQRRVP